MNSYPDWLEKAAFESTLLDHERFNQLVRDGVITRHELNRSILYLEHDPNYVSFLGYAGTRKDYAEAVKVATRIAAGRPLFAIIYKQNLDGIRESVIFNIIGDVPVYGGKLVIKVLGIK
jgi:hypothetical protein